MRFWHLTKMQKVLSLAEPKKAKKCRKKPAQKEDVTLKSLKIEGTKKANMCGGCKDTTKKMQLIRFFTPYATCKMRWHVAAQIFYEEKMQRRSLFVVLTHFCQKCVQIQSSSNEGMWMSADSLKKHNILLLMLLPSAHDILEHQLTVGVL